MLGPEWESELHLSLSTGHYPRWMVHIRGLECGSVFYGEHHISVQDGTTDADHCSNVKVCCSDRGPSIIDTRLLYLFFCTKDFYQTHSPI